jgi:hypothetical protein
MKDWLEDAIDQIALGDFLADSSLSCGQRFGLIAVDNAIEFMLNAYVEVDRQLVGGRKPGSITRKEWADKSSKFPVLVNFVVGLQPNLADLEDEINRRHKFRNDLYHTGLPKTTSAKQVHSHSKLARQVLSTLYGIDPSAEEWPDKVASIGNTLLEGGPSPTLRHEVTFEKVDDTVRFTCSEQPNARDAIALAIFGFVTRKAEAPDRSQLAKSLALSGNTSSPTVVSNRLSDLRRDKWVKRGELALTAKGRKELAKTYLI